MMSITWLEEKVTQHPTPPQTALILEASEAMKIKAQVL